MQTSISVFLKPPGRAPCSEANVDDPPSPAPCIRDRAELRTAHPGCVFANTLTSLMFPFPPLVTCQHGQRETLRLRSRTSCTTHRRGSDLKLEKSALWWRSPYVRKHCQSCDVKSCVFPPLSRCLLGRGLLSGLICWTCLSDLGTDGLDIILLDRRLQNTVSISPEVVDKLNQDRSTDCELMLCSSLCSSHEAR